MKTEKAIFVWIVIVLTLTTMLGCQDTPREKVIVGRQGEQIEDVVMGSPSLQSLSFESDRWLESFQLPTVNCIIDAKISVANSEIPVFEIERRSFQEDEVLTMTQYFSNDAIQFANTSNTKKDIELELISARRGMYQIIDGKEGFYPYEGQDAYIALLEEKLLSANEHETFKDISNFNVHFPMDCTFITSEKSKTYFFADHGMFYMTTAKHGIVQPEKWVVSGNAYPGEPVGTTIDNVNISQDNAVDTIERTLESLGISNFSITEIDKARSLHNFTYETLSTGWRIILCRNDGNSIPFDLRSTNSVGFLKYSDSSQYSATWIPERIIIYVSSKGIESFEWTSPMRITKILNENVPVLDFDQIKNRIREIVTYGCSWKEDTTSSSTLVISEVALSHVMIPKINDQKVRLLAPVWIVYYTADDDIETVFGINAIDGSVADLGLRAELPTN